MNKEFTQENLSYIFDNEQNKYSGNLALIADAKIEVDEDNDDDKGEKDEEKGEKDEEKGEKDEEKGEKDEENGKEIEIEGNANKLLAFLENNDIFNLPRNISELEIEVEGGKQALSKLLNNQNFNNLLDEFGLPTGNKLKSKLRGDEVEIEREITLLDGSTLSLELEAEEGEFEIGLELERGDNYIGLNTRDPEEVIQENSRIIAEALKEIDEQNPNEERRAELEEIIAQAKQDRDSVLQKYVGDLRDNVIIEPHENDPKINTITIFDFDGDRQQTFFGTNIVAWNLDVVSDSVFKIGQDIRSKPENLKEDKEKIPNDPTILPDDTTITTALGLGGSAAQGRVQPYPGDIDFSDTYLVRGPDAESAARAVANTIIEFVKRNRRNLEKKFEFTGIFISGLGRINYQKLVDPNNYNRIVGALQNLNPKKGNVNTFWRAIVDGEEIGGAKQERFIEITKILNITAQKNSSDELLFATKQTIDEELVNATSFSEEDNFFLTRVSGAEYQTAFIQKPELIPDEKLSDYAITIRKSALDLFGDGKYLKAAKRSFNYLLSIGNIEGIEYIENSGIFEGPEARVNQEVAVMDAIGKALKTKIKGKKNPATRILTVGQASIMLDNSADVIQDSFGEEPTENIVSGLQDLAESIGSIKPDNRFLPQNNAQGNLLEKLVGETQALINESLQDPVTELISTYIEPYYQGFDSLPNTIDEIDTIVAGNQTLNNNLPSEESLFNNDIIGFPLMNELSLLV